MTRAEAQIDDVVATIAPAITADAIRSRPCIECGKLTTGSTGAAGLRWSILCQPCKDAADAALDRRVRDTAQALATFKRQTAAPQVTAGFDFDAPKCVCGCTEFVEVDATEPEADTGYPGNKRGLDCKDCGEFYERE